MIWHSAANRDAAAFDDPDRFDVTRSAGHHLGLGAGSHYCLGASLATLELRVVLEALVDRVGDAHLLEPPRRLASSVISGYKNVRVELMPR